MPRLPLTPRVDRLLLKPNVAVVASLRPDGTPHTAATWYEWRAGRILVNMDATRKRLGYMRANPAVSVNVIDVDDMYTSVSLSGKIVEFVDDVGLRDIDALCRRYLGNAYPDRSSPRVSAWIEVETWNIWDSARETAGLDELLVPTAEA
jgi:PPOX class probable F420-dependent enzyme